jgi:hypothetical protein
MEFTDATTISMVRNLNVILSNVGDDSVLPYITNHAFPRVKFRLLTATDTLGRNVFYGKITDLSNPGVQRAAEILLEQVLAVDVVTTGIRQIVAKLACAMMTSQLAAQIDAQRDYAKLLEKQALDDLENFIRSPVLGGVVSAIQATVSDNHQDQTFALSVDVNPATVDFVKGTGTAVAGATQAGKLVVYVDGTKLSVDIAAGDSPATIMRKLSLLTVQQAGFRKIEVISLDKVKPESVVSKVVRDTVNNKDVTISFKASIVEGELQPRNSSMGLASFVGAALVNETAGELRPGISGLVLGYGGSYSGLSSSAHPTIFVDIKNCNFMLPMSTNECHSSTDYLAFKGSTGASASSFKYKVYQGSIARAEVVVAIPASSSALAVAEAVIASFKTSPAAKGVLGVVFPTMKLSVGSPAIEEYAPVIDFAGYTTEADVDVKFVFEVTELPAGITTTVVSKESNTASAFSSTKDSILISGISLNRTEAIQLEPSNLGGVSAVQGNTSTQMKDGLSKIKRMLDTGM